MKYHINTVVVGLLLRMDSKTCRRFIKFVNRIERNLYSFNVSEALEFRFITIFLRNLKKKRSCHFQRIFMEKLTVKLLFSYAQFID